MDHRIRVEKRKGVVKIDGSNPLSPPPPTCNTPLSYLYIYNTPGTDNRLFEN